MAGMIRKSLDAPEETRPFEGGMGKLELVNIEAGPVGRAMDDGQEMEFGPGDFSVIPPGHDAWIVSDDPCVVIDWQGFADYARR